MPNVTQIAAMAIAEKINATVLEAVLDWGEAVNRAESLTDGTKEHAFAVTRARLCGTRVMELAMGLASKLRTGR